MWRIAFPDRLYLFLNISRISSSGMSPGILPQLPSTVADRVDLSLNEWRRQDTVSCPRENTRSTSTEVAMQTKSDHRYNYSITITKLLPGILRMSNAMQASWLPPACKADQCAIGSLQCPSGGAARYSSNSSPLTLTLKLSMSWKKASGP